MFRMSTVLAATENIKNTSVNGLMGIIGINARAHVPEAMVVPATHRDLATPRLP